VLTTTSRGCWGPIITALLVVTISQSTSLAEDGVDEYPTQIILNISDGTSINDFSIVSGTILDETPPESATWELLDSFGTRHFVDFTDDLEVDSAPGLRNKWTFEIEINPQIIGPCACTIVVTAIDDSGNSDSALMSIFISPNTHQLPPTIHIIGDSINSWSSQVHIVNANSMTNFYEEPVFEYIFRNSSIVKCSYPNFLSSQVDNNLPDDLITLNSTQITFGVDMDGRHVGPLTFEIDLTQYPDGWYDLVIFAFNPWNQEFSHDCTSIRVDNTAPIASIEGPQSIPEGVDGVMLDGSSSYDETWGIQGLTYIWSVIDIDEGSSTGMHHVVGADSRSIVVEPIRSGTYEVRLTVADHAGNLGHTSQIIDVKNIAPIVRLTIDGVPYSDNDEFTLLKDSTCVLDASGSSDTTNDAESLRFIWRVNNIPTYEGISRDFSWPEGIDDDFVLTLEVIDDDSNSSMISILVKDYDSGGAIPMPIIVLFLSAIFLIYSVVNSRKISIRSDIPKWS